MSHNGIGIGGAKVGRILEFGGVKREFDFHLLLLSWLLSWLMLLLLLLFLLLLLLLLLVLFLCVN